MVLLSRGVTIQLVGYYCDHGNAKYKWTRYGLKKKKMYIQNPSGKDMIRGQTHLAQPSFLKKIFKLYVPYFNIYQMTHGY